MPGSSETKEHYNSSLKKKHKIGEIIKKNYSATKHFRKPKHW